MNLAKSINFEQIKSRLLDSIAEHFDSVAIGFKQIGFAVNYPICTNIKTNSLTCLQCEMDATAKDGNNNLFLYIIRVVNRHNRIWLSIACFGETVHWFVSSASYFEATDNLKTDVDNFLKSAQLDIFNEIKTVK